MARPSKSVNEIENPYLKEWMVERGYHDLKEASDLSGVPYRTLAAWSTNKNLDNFAYIVDLAKKLGEDVPDWIKDLAKPSQIVHEI